VKNILHFLALLIVAILPFIGLSIIAYFIHTSNADSAGFILAVSMVILGMLISIITFRMAHQKGLLNFITIPFSSVSERGNPKQTNS